MTEVDIMNDLECCRKDNCKECSRCGTIGSCSDSLMSDALSVIKMQRDSLENAKESIERLSAEVERLDGASRISYTNDQLMFLVNQIIIESYRQGNGWYDSDNYIECQKGENWTELFNAMREFLKKVDYEHKYMIAVEVNDDVPAFRKR